MIFGLDLGATSRCGAETSLSKARSASARDRTIGANMRRERLARDLSQTTIAEALGVTFQQVQKYEKGTNRVAAVTLIDIASAIGCSLADLLAGLNEAVAREEGYAEIGEFFAVLAELDDAKRRDVIAFARAQARG